MDDESLIKKAIRSTTETKNKILEDRAILDTIRNISNEIIRAFKNDRKVLLCGNGGSAADAQHIAAELSGKFYLDRESLFAEPLGTNFSYITAVSNDYSYEEVFARDVVAKGRRGDILIGISTSGNSPNVINAIKTANNQEMITIGLTGMQGGKMNDICKYLIKVPSDDTPRIQESHILIGHIIAEIVERKIFGDKNL